MTWHSIGLESRLQITLKRCSSILYEKDGWGAGFSSDYSERIGGGTGDGCLDANEGDKGFGWGDGNGQGFGFGDSNGNGSSHDQQLSGSGWSHN